MPLERLKVQNFQIHDKEILELDPRVTSIIGPSDSGKSALIRALRWVCRNQPQGEEFIRFGSKGTTVTLEVDNHEIIRRRGKGKNTYHLDGSELKAFGNEVPQPVKDILRVDNTNFASQFDPVFWLSSSAGEVSRQLNSVVDLEIIDKSMSNIGAKVRKSREAVEIIRGRVEKARKRKEDLEWVVEADKDFKEIESKGEEKREAEKKQQALSRIRGVIETLRDTLKEGREKQKSLGEILVLATQSLKTQKEKQKLESLREEITSSEKVVARGKPDISQIEKVIEKYNTRGERQYLLRDLAEIIRKNQKDLVSKKEMVSALETELAEKTQGKCPVCGKEMRDGNDIKRFVGDGSACSR